MKLTAKLQKAWLLFMSVSRRGIICATGGAGDVLNSPTGALAGAVPSRPGKTDVPDLADSKPSFGDKQKPLYHTPLKWRKLVGKPQV